MNPHVEKIIEYFKNLKDKNILGHGYLFVGDDFAPVAEVIKTVGCRESPGACNVCWDCARLNEGNHPDLMVVAPEGVFIKIEQIRDAQRFLSLKSYCLKKKILVIKGANNLNITAAAAFLKTLEEPPDNSFIVLYASAIEGILPTIVSRTRRIFLPSAGNIALSDKRVVENFLKGEKIKFGDRKKLLQFLTTFSYMLRDYIAAKTGANNRLLASGEYEIILPAYGVERAAKILEKVLQIQAAYNSINENLGLSLIRMEL